MLKNFLCLIRTAPMAQKNTLALVACSQVIRILSKESKWSRVFEGAELEFNSCFSHFHSFLFVCYNWKALIVRKWPCCIVQLSEKLWYFLFIRACQNCFLTPCFNQEFYLGYLSYWSCMWCQCVLFACIATKSEMATFVKVIGKTWHNWRARSK